MSRLRALEAGVRRLARAAEIDPDAPPPDEIEGESFLDAVLAVLCEYEVAARELDQAPLRGAAPTLQRLVDRLSAARALVLEFHRIVGTAESSAVWIDGFPTCAEIARHEGAARALLAKAAAGGAPTKCASRYTIDRLLEIHERYEGEKTYGFVVGALELIGVRVNRRKVRDAERWRARREREANAHAHAAHLRSVLGK